MINSNRKTKELMGMSLVADYHRCLKCGAIWSFNPDVGHDRCPKCGSRELGPSMGPIPPVRGKRGLDAVFGKKDK